MEVIELSVGRDLTNEIVYDNKPISLFHCKVEITGKDLITIIDNNSNNGTWVNGVRIQRKNITRSDKLTLGTVEVNSEDFYSKLNRAFDRKRTDYSEDYKKILRKFSIYQKQRDKIIDPPKTWLVVRLGVGLAFILVLIFFKKLIPDSDTRYIIISTVGLLSVVSTLFTTPQSKKNQKIDQLRLEFEDILVCPKCKSTMINYSLTYWTGKTRCIRQECDAKYISH